MKFVKLYWGAVVTLLYALIYLLPLNLRLLWQPDETRYAEISREMLQRGDWIVPSLLGVRYFEKPVVGYWFNNVSLLLFGDSNFAVRFGVAFSTGASAALVYFLAMKMWNDRRTAGLAALIFLSMLLVLSVGTYSVIDPIVSFWLMASMVSFYLALQATGKREKVGAYILLGLACGLGVMTKGFLALAVPVVAALPIVIVRQRLKELLIFGPVAVLAAIAICMPWAVAIAQREPDYWHYFFWVEHVQRFADSNAQHKSPFWLYMPLLVLSSLPWVALLPGSLLKGWFERAARPELFFLLSWVVMPLLFFSIAKGKIVTYILPCMAPLAMLMAAYAQDAMSKGHVKVFRVNAMINGGLGLVGMGAIALFGFGLLPHIILLEKREWYKVVLAISGFAGWVAFAVMSAKRKGQFWPWAAACPVLICLIVGYAIPQRIIDNKMPQQLIRAHVDDFTQSRYLLSNNVGLATALAWELKRDDVKMYRQRGELDYGLSYQDAQERLVSEQEFPAWLDTARRKGSVALLLRMPDNGQLPSGMPHPDMASFAGRLAIVLYRQQP